ncbi:MAG: hypothetical protein JXA33_00825 [Anaerolineae bacterium]|nr:hypothetical protein [Anaerolineae bacterium]
MQNGWRSLRAIISMLTIVSTILGGFPWAVIQPAQAAAATTQLEKN